MKMGKKHKRITGGQKKRENGRTEDKNTDQS